MSTKDTSNRKIVSAIFRSGFVLFFLALVIKYFSWTDSPEVRYRKHYGAMYDMIFNESGKVNLAVMGSSRSQTMVGAKSIADHIYGDDAENKVVYNLSTSQRGKGFHYVMFRDLFENRDVDNVLLHYINTDKREKYEIHPWFYIIAKNKDIVESANKRTHLSWYKRMKYGLRVFNKKHSTIIEDFLKGRLALARNKKTKNIAKTRNHLASNPIRPKSILGSKYSSDAVLASGEKWDLDDEYENRNNFYINKISGLVFENSAKLFFNYIPLLGKPGLSKSTINQIEEKFSGKYMLFNKDELFEMYPAAYADCCHGSQYGREIYGGIISSKLLNKIK